MTPNKYRSVYTGPQIDNILSEVQNKIDKSVIIDDFTGGSDLVASAETVKTLNDTINQIKDPVFLKSLIETTSKTGSTISVAQTFIAAEFESDLYIGAKVVVGCKASDGSIQIVEALYGRSSTTNYVQSGTAIGNGLFTLSVQLSGNKVQLIATATVANLTFSADRVSTI